MVDTGDTIVGRLDHAVVRVTGADRLAYLDAVTSQALADAAPGEVLGALELDAHGAPLALFDVVVRPDDVLLLVPDPALGSDVVERLGSRTFLQDAAFAPADVAVVGVRGADAVKVVAAAGHPTPEPRTATVAADITVVGRPSGYDLVVPLSAADAVVDALAAAGASAADAQALDAARVAAGVPAWGREVRHPHLPEELGLLPTHVHLAKGCYPGQEAVARMWMLGRPRRRLATVRLTDGVAAGWAAGSGSDRVEVTSAADGVGLAFVPGDTEVGTRLHDAVEVLGLVGDGMPVPGHDPAVTRRRDTR